MDETKPKRGFQFSIRELLLITVIIGLALGWWLDHRAFVNIPRPVMHYLEKADAATAAKLLKTIWPDSQGVLFTVDARQNAIVAIARPSQQAVIQKWVEAFDQKP
jgi:hypothetical protein